MVPEAYVTTRLQRHPLVLRFRTRPELQVLTKNSLNFSSRPELQVLTNNSLNFSSRPELQVLRG